MRQFPCARSTFSCHCQGLFTASEETQAAAWFPLPRSNQGSHPFCVWSGGNCCQKPTAQASDGLCTRVDQRLQSFQGAEPRLSRTPSSMGTQAIVLLGPYYRERWGHRWKKLFYKFTGASSRPNSKISSKGNSISEPQFKWKLQLVLWAKFKRAKLVFFKGSTGDNLQRKCKNKVFSPTQTNPRMQ